MDTRWTPETTPTVRVLDDPAKKRLIIRMAKYYVRYKKTTYINVSKKFNIPRSSISNYFKNYLPLIDLDLAIRVNEKAKANRVKGMTLGLNKLLKLNERKKHS